MFGYRTLREQVIEEQHKSAALQEEVEKNAADVLYVSMMTDVDLDEDEEEEVEEDETQ